MRIIPSRFPLSAFDLWLCERSASDSTRNVYASRVRAVLSLVGSASDGPSDVAGVFEEAAVRQYLEEVSSTTRVQTLSAWRAYALFAHDQYAVVLSSLESDRPRASIRPPRLAPPAEIPSVGDLPLPVARALWDLVREKQVRPYVLAPDMVCGTRWRSVIFFDRRPPAAAYRIEIVHAGVHFFYAKPLTLWQVLWDWARGDAERPLDEQPLIPSSRGGHAPIEVRTVHAVMAAGRRSRLPELSEPPPPPVPSVPPLPPGRSPVVYAPPPPLAEEIVAPGGAQAPQAAPGDPFDTE